MESLRGDEEWDYLYGLASTRIGQHGWDEPKA